MESIEDPHPTVNDDDLLSTTEPLNLTSIDDDSKILIFELLEWTDLIRIAETSKKLYTAACYVYRRKYGKGRLKIVPVGIMAHYEKIPDVQPNISVYNRVDIFKILRNFGHIISHILLPYRLYEGHLDSFVFHIESYVAKYCSKTLKQFSLLYPPIALFKEIGTPFINVENIILDGYGISINELRFSSNFPNLKFLKLDILHIAFNVIPISIPSMKCLHIYSRGNNGLNFKENTIKEFLKVNPQLEELELDLVKRYSYIIFQDLNEYLPALKRFHLKMPSDTNTINVGRYHFENVIDFRMWPQSNKIANIPFTFGKLECFDYAAPCSGNGTIESFILDFINENKHLRAIKLHGVGDGIDRLFQLESVLKNIEELDIQVMKVLPLSASDDILNLLSQSQSLKRLTLRGSYFGSYFENLNDLVKSKIFKREEGPYWGSDVKLTFHP